MVLIKCNTLYPCVYTTIVYLIHLFIISYDKTELLNQKLTTAQAFPSHYGPGSFKYGVKKNLTRPP